MASNTLSDINSSGPKIAVVDDIVKEGKDLAHTLHRRLPSPWQAIFAEPLVDPETYPTWLIAHDIWALVLDWQLSLVGKKMGEKGVNYMADTVIQQVRAVMPDYPIYVITTKVDRRLQSQWFGDVETYESRSVFLRELPGISKRIVRSAARFQTAHHDSLATIARLARKAATIGLTEKDLADLDAARSSVRLDAVEIPPANISSILANADVVRAEIDEIIRTIKSKLKGAD